MYLMMMILMITYNFKLLLNFPVNIDVMSPHSFHGEQTTSVESHLGEDS